MSKTNEHHTAVKEESTDRFSSDLNELKSSFNQLREDVTTLLGNASGTAKSGVGMLRDHATNAAMDFKHRGVESVERVEEKITRNPLLSIAAAIGVGFVFAKLFMRK